MSKDETTKETAEAETTEEKLKRKVKAGTFTAKKMQAIVAMIPYIVKEVGSSSFIPKLAKDVGMSERTLWRYYADRDNWMPILSGISAQKAIGSIAEKFLITKGIRKTMWLAIRDAKPFNELLGLDKIMQSVYKEITIMQTLGLLPNLAPEEKGVEFAVKIINQFKKKDGSFVEVDRVADLPEEDDEDKEDEDPAKVDQ